MKRLFFAAAALFATVACTSYDEENITPETENAGIPVILNIAANPSADSRVAIDTSDPNVWKVTWAEDDDVMIYPTDDDSYAGAVQMTIPEGGYDPEVATFESVYDSEYGQGGVQAGKTYRIVHPFILHEGLIQNGDYKFDLSQQNEGLNNTYTVSNTNFKLDAPTNVYEASDLSMSHVGAILDLNLRFSNVAEDLTLKSVKVLDIPTYQTVDLEVLDVTDAGFVLSQENGDMNVTIDNISITPSTTDVISLKFNIFPFATEKMNFKFYFENAAGDVIILEKSSTFTASFERAKFYTINLNCDMSASQGLGAALDIKEVKVAGNLISMNVDINNDVCDGYLYNCAYPEDYVALDEREDEKDEGLQTPGGNAGESGQTPYGYESAMAYHTSGWNTATVEFLESNREYKVGIVAYKMVGGEREMVGKPTVYTFTTTSREAAKDLSEATVGVTIENVKYTSFDVTFDRNESFAYYRGYAPKAVVDTYEGADIAEKLYAWMNDDLTEDSYGNKHCWFDENINGPQTFFASDKFKDIVTVAESKSEKFDKNLSLGTDYYFFTFAVDQDGIGPIISQEFSTMSATINETLTPSVIVTPVTTEANAKFTFGGSAKVVYYNMDKTYTDPENENYVSAKDIYENIVSGKFTSACYNEAQPVTISSLVNGSTYVLYYVGFETSSYGAVSPVTTLKKIEYTCSAPTFTSAATLDITINGEPEYYQETSWNGTVEGYKVTYDVALDGAVNYIYGFYASNQLSGVESDEDLGVYVLSHNPNSFAIDEVEDQLTFDFPIGEGKKAVFVPIDAAGEYGTPQVVTYSPNSYDSSITASIELVGSPVIDSYNYGDATVNFNIVKGATTESFIYCAFSKQEVAVDFADLNSVGDYVILHGTKADASVTAINDIVLAGDYESAFCIVPVDADGNYGTPATYLYGAWLSDQFSSPATVELTFGDYDLVQEDYGWGGPGPANPSLKLNVTMKEGAVEYYYKAVSPWDLNGLDKDSEFDMMTLANDVVTGYNGSAWGSQKGTENGLMPKWLTMYEPSEGYDIVVVAGDGNGKYGMPVFYDYTEADQVVE